MRQSVRLGRIVGIPIGMHWTVVVIAALITDMLAAGWLPAVIPHESAGLYWAVAVAGAVLFIAALAAHEIAHAIVARRYGVQVRSITLWALGGIAELEGEPPTARADVRIAIAGPATSLAAGIVFGGAAILDRSWHGPAVVTAMLAWLSVMNVALAVFNLLPGAPLDGGRILRGLLWKRYGDRQRASRAAARSGQVHRRPGFPGQLAAGPPAAAWPVACRGRRRPAGDRAGDHGGAAARLAARPAAYQLTGRERLVSLAGQARLGYGLQIRAAGTRPAGRRSQGTGISALASAVTASHAGHR